jgi:hypothetical protein
MIEKNDIHRRPNRRENAGPDRLFVRLRTCVDFTRYINPPPISTTSGGCAVSSRRSRAQPAPVGVFRPVPGIVLAAELRTRPGLGVTGADSSILYLRSLGHTCSVRHLAKVPPGKSSPLIRHIQFRLSWDCPYGLKGGRLLFEHYSSNITLRTWVLAADPALRAAGAALRRSPLARLATPARCAAQRCAACSTAGPEG